MLAMRSGERSPFSVSNWSSRQQGLVQIHGALCMLGPSPAGTGRTTLKSLGAGLRRSLGPDRATLQCYDGRCGYRE